MAITTQDQLLAAFSSKKQRFPIAKAPAEGTSVGIGNTCTTWRFTGYPAQPAVPTSVAYLDNTTTGGIPYANPTGGDTLYFGRSFLGASVAGGLELHDRLAHMAGLSGTVTTPQTVGIDLFANSGTSNLAARIGADYTKVQWWLEWFTATGATAVTATVSYTDQTGTSGKTTTVALATNRPAKQAIQIFPSGTDQIRSIESVTLSVSTGTAGNFGVVATKEISSQSMPIASVPIQYNWADLGLPVIPSSACLFFMLDNSSSSNPATIGGSVLFCAG